MTAQISRLQHIRAFVWIICLAAISLTAPVARAQGDGYLTNQNTTGVVDFGSYQFGDIDNVNLQNGGVNLRIPLFTLKGRGSDEGVVLNYSSKFWTMQLSQIPQANGWSYSLNWGNSFTVGPTISKATLHQGRVNSNQQIYQCRHWSFTDSGGTPHYLVWNVHVYTNFSYTAADGTKYIFPNRLFIPIDPPIPAAPLCYSDGAPGSLNTALYDWGDGQNITTGMSSSGTLQLQTTPNPDNPFSPIFSVLDKHGRSGSGDIDTNGNWSGWDGGGPDTVGRPSPISASGISMIDSNGQPQPYTLTGQTITGNPQFPSTISGTVPIFSLPNGWTYTVLTNVALPNNLSYQFSYLLPDGTTNPFGEVTRVTLPSGGYIRYVYATLPAFDPFQGAIAGIDSRRVVERDVSPDGVAAHEQQWLYDYEKDPTGTYLSITKVTDPLGNVTVHSFGPLGEMQTKIYSGSSTLLKQIDNVWATDNGPTQANQIRSFADETQRQTNFPVPYISVGSRNPRIISTTTTLTDIAPNQVSQTQTTYDTETYTFDTSDSGGTNLFTYNDTRMNPTEFDEFDYGSGVPGNLLRKTTYTYLHDANPAYVNLHILDRPASKTVFDGAGLQAAQSTYEYDVYTQGISVSGAVQHLSAFNTSYLTRGNVTAVKKWRNTDGALLTTRNQYDDAGNVTSATDPGGHTTTFDYTDSWTTVAGGSTCAPSGGQARAYVTRITNALGQQTSSNYFSCSSLTASSTDPNSQTVTNSYDLFGRLAIQTRPDGGSTNWTYTDASNSAARVVTIGNGVSPHTSQFSYDGLERINSILLTSDPEGVVHNDTVYDPLGRVSQSYNPYRNSGEPTYGFTSFAYDGLGRTTVTTAQDGNRTTATYSGNSVTVTDPALKQRRSFTDAAGRLIEVDEPGSIGTVPATSGTGTITVNGTEFLSGGTAGQGSVSVSGIDGFYVPTGCRTQTCRVFDSGSITVTVAGFTFIENYSHTITGAASNLATDFNNANGCPVSASVSGGVITFTSKATGSSTNYSLSARSSSFDPSHFTPASVTATASGSTLTGGTGGATVYDTGTVSVTVHGFVGSASYAQGSTTSSIATSLASALSAAGSPVTATANGNVVTLTSIATGSASNYSLQPAWASNDPADFPTSSFSDAGSTLTGGTDSSFSTDLSLSTPAVTLYTYNALDDLTCVEQHGTATGQTGCSADPSVDASSAWRIRRFTYDSLGRLLSAKNPESGTIAYTYDADGNVITNTDARGIVATMVYDQGNRLTQKSYSDSTPTATFTYDVTSAEGQSLTNTVGRLVEVQNANAKTVNSYDSMGRVTSQWQCTPVNCGSSWFSLTYQHNFLGELTQETTPMGFTLNQTYDPAARLLNLISSWSDAQHPANLLSVDPTAGYTPAGAFAKMTYGNGLVETSVYNNRLQPTNMRTYNPANNNADVLNLTYGFSDANGHNNGNVLTFNSTATQIFMRSYTYDGLNRLATMSSPADASGCDGLFWTYDAWGNRLAQTTTPVTGGSCHSPNHTASTLNRISDPGFGYDAAGNTIQGPDPSTSTTDDYTYDAENHMTAVSGGSAGSYVYNADGQRVRKIANGVTTDYVYNGSDVVAEIEGSTWVKGYVHSGTQFVAQYSGVLGVTGATTSFSHTDHLGSTRVLTTVGGSIQECDDYLPFGESWSCGGTPTTTHKFTSKEHDGESGLDDFGARYYSSVTGRFTTADGFGNDFELANPQRFNLYSYAVNNPLEYVDNTGNTIRYADNMPTDVRNAIEDAINALRQTVDGQQFIAKYDLDRKDGGLDVTINVTDLGRLSRLGIDNHGQIVNVDVPGDFDPHIQHNSFGDGTETYTVGDAEMNIDLNQIKVAFSAELNLVKLAEVLAHETFHAVQAANDPRKFVQDQKNEASKLHDDRQQEIDAQAYAKRVDEEIARIARAIKKDREQKAKDERKKKKAKGVGSEIVDQ